MDILTEVQSRRTPNFIGVFLELQSTVFCTKLENITGKTVGVITCTLQQKCWKDRWMDEQEVNMISYKAPIFSMWGLEILNMDLSVSTFPYNLQILCQWFLQSTGYNSRVSFPWGSFTMLFYIHWYFYLPFRVFTYLGPGI